VSLVQVVGIALASSPVVPPAPASVTPGAPASPLPVSDEEELALHAVDATTTRRKNRRMAVHDGPKNLPCHADCRRNFSAVSVGDAVNVHRGKTLRRDAQPPRDSRRELLTRCVPTIGCAASEPWG
jgi:hypothetical protein